MAEAQEKKRAQIRGIPKVGVRNKEDGGPRSGSERSPRVLSHLCVRADLTPPEGLNRGPVGS